MIAMKKEKERVMVFLGVNDKNENIVFVNNESANILVEDGARCPPYCPEEYVLIK